MDTIQISNDVFAGMCVSIAMLASTCVFIFMDVRRERRRRTSTEAAYASVNGTLSEIKQQEKYWREAHAKLVVDNDMLNEALGKANESVVRELKRMEMKQQRKLERAKKLSDNAIHSGKPKNKTI